MEEKIINPEAWLQLGLGGAALFLVFVFIVLFMWFYVRNNNKSLMNLGDKIEKLAESNNDIVKTLVHTVVKVTEDQTNNVHLLNQINEGITDIKMSVGSLTAKTEAMVNMKCRAMVVQERENVH